MSKGVLAESKAFFNWDSLHARHYKSCQTATTRHGVTRKEAQNKAYRKPV